MSEIFAQGDLLIERVPDVTPSGTVAENAEGAALVLLEGELTGHNHAVRERVTLFRDDRLAQDHRAFVHFLDSHKVLLFDDDHVPVPPVTAWEPGKSYSYTRTKFIPIYPYVGDVDVRVGLQPVGRGERVALKGEDAGLHEYSVAKMELLPQTENIFLVYKEGWHNPESSAQNPSLERTWTKKDALVSFKNPKKDIIVYLEADTNAKAFDQQAYDFSMKRSLEILAALR